MIITHGVYRFAPKRVAYRGDYCLRCQSERVAELRRTFDAGHLFFVPILPLGYRQHWHCSICGRDPHERIASSRGFRLFAAIAFGCFAAFAWLIPIDGPEVAPIAWGLRGGTTACFLAAYAWLRFGRTSEPLPQRLAGVRPLPDDFCYYCGGSLDAEGFCGSCQVWRLDGLSTSGGLPHHRKNR